MAFTKAGKRHLINQLQALVQSVQTEKDFPRWKISVTFQPRPSFPTAAGSHFYCEEKCRKLNPEPTSHSSFERCSICTPNTMAHNHRTCTLHWNLYWILCLCENCWIVVEGVWVVGEEAQCWLKKATEMENEDCVCVWETSIFGLELLLKCFMQSLSSFCCGYSTCLLFQHKLLDYWYKNFMALNRLPWSLCQLSQDERKDTQ